MTTARLPSLLGRSYRALNADPNSYIALRLSYPTGGTWSVASDILTLQPTQVPRPAPTVISLAPPTTIADVANLAAAAGWQVTDLDSTRRGRGAITLLPAAAPSADGAILAHDSLLFALLDAVAGEIQDAGAAASDAPRQMVAGTASDIWLDEIGAYYAVPRLTGEADAQYAPRLVAEVLRPKSNNVAMAAIIAEATGQPTVVTDAVVYTNPVPTYDGSITHNAAYTHSATAKANYGWFDVSTTFALLGSGSITAFRALITAQVERLKAAGTLMRRLILSGGNIADAAPGPTDEPDGIADLRVVLGLTLADTPDAPTETTPALTGGLSFTDSPEPATEAASLSISYTHKLNGAWTLDGRKNLASGTTLVEAS